METTANLLRKQALGRVRERSYDLIVIGGGVTGAGIALDAAHRGMSVLLLEKTDFASGTSSRSTKLIHGGLRYLKQLEFRLVWQVGRERAILHRLARHLVHPEKMLLPIVRGGSLGKFSTSLGVWVYDLLAGVAPRDRRVMLSRGEALAAEPLLDTEKVLGACLYAEYRTDDARLTFALIKTAMEHGADCMNYLEAKGFIYDEKGAVKGVRMKDNTNRDTPVFEVQAKCVVNAAGPWADQVMEMDQPKKQKNLFLSKGVHLVVPYSRLPLRQSAYFDLQDGRMAFAIPRNGTTYIGTTDTRYAESIDDVQALEEDAAYLIEGTRQMFPSVDLVRSDVVSSWAGLRPLIYEPNKPGSEISRKEEVFLTDSGLISIAGGKLTGYRLMAKRVVDIAAKNLQKTVAVKYPSCKTHQIRLWGNRFETRDEMEAFLRTLEKRVISAGLPLSRASYLLQNYGGQAEKILDTMEAQASPDAEPRLLLAELHYAIREESAVRPMDFLLRRTGRAYFEMPGLENYLPLVLSVFQQQWEWKQEQLAGEEASTRAALDKLSMRHG